MSRELVDFFEREVPTIVTAGLGLVGGIAMLLRYDRMVGLIAALPLVPVLTVYTAMGRRAHRLNKDLNDETEREVDLIARGRPGPLASHFRRRGRLRVRLSNAEAGSWSLVELFSITAVVLVLLRMTALPSSTPCWPTSGGCWDASTRSRRCCGAWPAWSTSAAA